MAKATEETAMVPLENYEAARYGIPETIALLHENLGDSTKAGALDLERVAIPPQGGTQWQVPDVSGTTRGETALTGIIIAHSTVRLYWRQSIDEGGSGNPPDCVSEDGRAGVGDPGGICALCPMNQWSSTDKANSRAKACTERHHVLLLMPDSLLPRLISLPPSSLRAWRSYMVGLSGQVARPYYAVVTELGLVATKNATGIAYSEATFRMVGEVPAGLVPSLRAMAAEFAALSTVGEADLSPEVAS